MKPFHPKYYNMMMMCHDVPVLRIFFCGGACNAIRERLLLSHSPTSSYFIGNTKSVY